MKTQLPAFVVFSIVCALLSGCATITPTPISLPVSFEQVWYRPTLAKPGFLVMTDTGTVTVSTNGVAFIGKKGTTEINYENIQHLAFGKVGYDFINSWVTVKYRDSDRDSYALFRGGRNFGRGGGGEAYHIFLSIKFGLDQKGLGSVVEK